MNPFHKFVFALALSGLFGCAGNLPESYSLDGKSNVSAIYGRFQYTANENQNASITIRQLETGKTVTIRGNNKSSVQEFVRELAPGKWKIEGYGLAALPSFARTVSAPQKTGNSQIDDFQKRQYEIQKSEADLEQLSKNGEAAGKNKYSSPKGNLIFEIKPGKLVYVGCWDLDEKGALRIKNEKEMDDLTISEGYKGLSAGDAIISIPKATETDSAGGVPSTHTGSVE